MKTLQLQSLMLYCLTSLLLLPTVVFGNNDENDEYGMFYFDPSGMDFSDGAIYPRACITQSGQDYVVFDLFQSAYHNQCKRRSLGMYKMDLVSYVVAFAKQSKQDNEVNGGNGYEVDDDVLDYLECQQYYYNNNMFYLKLGCRENTGKGFQINAYNDMYCTEKANTNYNLGIDISSLRVSFETCKSCVTQSRYSQYGNNNNNNNGGDAYYYEEMQFDYETPMCSAAYNYAQNCNGGCKRATRKVAKGGSRSSGGYSGDGFSPLGKFFLCVMSLSAIFFLLASLAQRKKMSKTDAVLEEAAIKSAGIDKKYIPRIFVGVAIFIILLILLRRKILAWFFLTTVNVALLSYWIHLKNKADEKAAVGGFQLYSEGAAA